MRYQIIKHSQHQFLEGDVEHWWHDETGRGIRTRFSDDLLWLVYVTLEYIDFTGNMDTCIAIRIAYKKNGHVFVRSGAGIVADSVPEKEYEECANKARAVMNALKMAQEGDL